jgi:uracil-DNA glycosylase
MRLSQSDLFNDAGDALKVAQPSNQLLAADWPPKLEALTQGWQELLGHFWRSPTGLLLDQKMRAGLSAGRVFFPQAVYKAFALTPFENVKVVVLGQDPYHGPDQAEGLAFSVGPGQKIPPSLRNIFKEIQRDLGVPMPTGPQAGSLVRWSEQGVLLLNTVLTVEQAQPASHAGRGWEVLTSAVLQALMDRPSPTVFMAWGAHAHALVAHLPARHLLLAANHPSPLSASRPPKPFVGCGHFSAANAWLRSHGREPVQW